MPSTRTLPKHANFPRSYLIHISPVYVYVQDYIKKNKVKQKSSMIGIPHLILSRSF